MIFLITNDESLMFIVFLITNHTMGTGYDSRKYLMLAFSGSNGRRVHVVCC